MIEDRSLFFSYLDSSFIPPRNDSQSWVCSVSTSCLDSSLPDYEFLRNVRDVNYYGHNHHYYNNNTYYSYHYYHHHNYFIIIIVVNIVIIILIITDVTSNIIVMTNSDIEKLLGKLDTL